jgi:hypothetical protein
VRCLPGLSKREGYREGTTQDGKNSGTADRRRAREDGEDLTGSPLSERKARLATMLSLAAASSATFDAGTESLRTRRWRKADSNRWSHFRTSTTAAPARCRRPPASELHYLSLLPIQSASLSQVGPAVRIRFPPAASHERTLGARCSRRTSLQLPEAVDRRKRAGASMPPIISRVNVPIWPDPARPPPHSGEAPRTIRYRCGRERFRLARPPAGSPTRRTRRAQCSSTRRRSRPRNPERRF